MAERLCSEEKKEINLQMKLKWVIICKSIILTLLTVFLSFNNVLIGQPFIKDSINRVNVKPKFLKLKGEMASYFKMRKETLTFVFSNNLSDSISLIVNDSTFISSFFHKDSTLGIDKSRLLEMIKISNGKKLLRKKTTKCILVFHKRRVKLFFDLNKAYLHYVVKLDDKANSWSVVGLNRYIASY
jgi:hypothetical protein